MFIGVFPVRNLAFAREGIVTSARLIILVPVQQSLVRRSAFWCSELASSATPLSLSQRCGLFVKTIPTHTSHYFVTGIRERHTSSRLTCCAVQGYLMNTFPIRFRNLARFFGSEGWRASWPTYDSNISTLSFISRQLIAPQSRLHATIAFF